MKTELLVTGLILTSVSAANAAQPSVIVRQQQQAEAQDLDAQKLGAISLLLEAEILKPNAKGTDIVIDRKVLEELVNRGMIQNINSATGGWTPGTEK